MKSVTELEVARDSWSEGGEEQRDASEGRVDTGLYCGQSYGGATFRLPPLIYFFRCSFLVAPGENTLCSRDHY